MNIVLALILIQPPPPGTTGELQFPRMSTPYSCSAGREGRVYYDMDTEIPMWCDDTDWQPFGTTISGTNPFLARFNSAGTNVEDSDMSNPGVPAAGASGDIFNITETLNAADGTDFVTGLRMTLTNASHSGASNIVSGMILTLSGSGSANAVESAYTMTGAWDYGINFNFFQVAGAKPTAGGSGNYVNITSDPAAMNGNDTVNFLLIEVNQAPNDDTGTGNILNGLRIADLAEDADVTENAINIGDGWDRGVRFENTFTNPLIYAANSGGDATTLIDSADSTPNFLFSGTGTPLFALQGGREVTHSMGTDLSLSGTTLTIDPDATVVEVFGDGSDTVSIITAPTTASHTERVTFICQDADVTFIDADAAGAAGTINLAGAATNFVCSADDTLTLAYYVAPVSGNARWVEVSRSVN